MDYFKLTEWIKIDYYKMVYFKLTKWIKIDYYKMALSEIIVGIDTFFRYAFMMWLSYVCISEYTKIMNIIKKMEEKHNELTVRFDTFHDCIQKYVFHNAEMLKGIEPLLKLRVEKLEEAYVLDRHAKDRTYAMGDFIRYGDGHHEITAVVIAVIPRENEFIEIIAKSYKYAWEEEIISLKISKGYDARIPHPYGIHIRDKRINPFSTMMCYISTAPSKYTMSKL